MKILFLPVFLFGCNTPVFKESLPQILGVSKVDINSHKRIDVSGGLRKSYLLEIYDLSPTTVQVFLEGEKRLPAKEIYGPWTKSGWFNSPLKENSLYGKIASVVLISDWGSSMLKEELTRINDAISRGTIYYGFYCKPDTVQPEHVQMYILDTLSNNLYIMDSNM
jgi:hypothetical protein